ncbi:MAG TPA: carboxypeptidase regulatory-like domain-containing protein, partial [Blastocatellia bacterium]|nr:carboxypeptidase regulatory-like domain-containing protein [Blastocatellia bacterium]
MKTQDKKRFFRMISPMLVAALAIQLLIPIGSLAQTDSGRISGTVRDQAKAVIQGASITIKNERTGEERTVTSNDQGSYLVSNLKPSTYSVRVSVQGFSTSEIIGLNVLVGDTQTADVEVKPSGTSESVTIVAAEGAMLETDSATMGANVNSREVQALPFNGRQLSQLYLQAPGSLNSGSGTFGDIRFSGRAVEQNAIRYDGVEGSAIIDAAPGNLNGEIASPFRLQASLENVQEFRVDSNSYPAEYGTGTGGQVNVVTKSGGNSFHGSVFEYLRNDKLDARNWFDRDFKNPLRLNQFGASIGGPIVKDRLFFFASYEGYRLRSGINIVEGVPKLSRCSSAVPAVRPLCEGAFLGAGGTRTVTNPLTSPDFDIGQLAASNPVNENSVAVRFDFRANEKNTFYVRYFRDQGDNDQP